MGKKIDMTGWVMKEHGILDSKLTVLYEDKEYVKNRKTLVGPHWLCKCECGNITTVLGQSLRNGKTKSCGCLKKENTAAKDLTNKKFGKLIAIKPTKERSFGGSIVWECICSCGISTFASAHDLNSGHKQSCGCLSSKGELKIGKLLKENNIPFEKQKTFKDFYSENNRPFRFDFWINNSFLLEFDGRQHFEGPESKWKEGLSLEEIQKRDKIKNDYCKKNKIPLKRIPYFKLKDLTIEDILSDKFLVKGDE